MPLYYANAQLIEVNSVDLVIEVPNRAAAEQALARGEGTIIERTDSEETFQLDYIETVKGQADKAEVRKQAAASRFGNPASSLGWAYESATSNERAQYERRIRKTA